MAEIVLTIVSPLIEAAVATANSFAGAKISLDWDLAKELRELALSLAMIQEVLKDAEEKQESNQAVRLWLQHLGDAAYDAVDVLDEYAYEVLKHKAKTQGQKRKHISLSCLSKTQGQKRKQVRSVARLSKFTSFPFNMAEKIRKINESLDKLQKNAAWLRLIKSSDETRPSRRQNVKTHSVLDCSKVVGRHNDVSDIVKMLGEKRSQHPLSGITIVGMGGIGKTTLAKSICEMVKEQKLYELVAWLCVSENFDEQKIFGELLEYLSDSASQPSNFDALLKKLAEKLENKKILLVLDDLWEENPDKWNKFSSCLSTILKTTGNTIIVTTRSDKVAFIMERLPMHRHDTMKLTEEECWLIIKDIVLRSSTETSSLSELEVTGKEIAKKCGGLPLVASVIGGTLSRAMDKDKWKEILDDKAWAMQEENKKILSVLKISFDRLPSPLKKCFSYCSIFPKDFVIEKDDLIQLWIAQGFVYGSNENRMAVEDIGNEYFIELLSNSLFQDTKWDQYGNIESCKMHDLVHDLALLVSKGETLIWDTSCSIDDQNSSTIRHLRVKSEGKNHPTIPRSIARRLHSLFSGVDVFSNMASNLKSLRSLKLTGGYYDGEKKLPVSLGKLKHLRYLDISGTRVTAIPKSFSKLYNLQTLKFLNCYVGKHLYGTANLISLRHIYSSYPTDISIMQLTSLQTLSEFVVGTKKGQRIEDLACLSQLGGKLGISKLELVRSKIEASKANLKEKKKLHKLDLRWSKNNRRRAVNNNNNDEEVLESLKPHSALKSLFIDGYKGKKFSSWMMSGVNSSGSTFLLNNMVELMLINCNECKCIPSLGRLPSLKVLCIDGMENVRKMGHELQVGRVELIKLFPALEILTVRNMQRLKEWVEVVEDAAVGSQGVTVFPSLQKLLIERCPSLKTWSMGGFSSHHKLSVLSIISCRNLVAIPNLDGLSALKTLFVLYCNGLTSLPLGLGSCLHLQSLEIERCDKLNSIPSINGLISLERIWLSYCDGLTCLPIGLDSCISLQKLEIKSCPNLISIPEDIGKLCSLNFLKITSCKGLRSIPEDIGKLCSLNFLEITGCTNLRSIPEEGLGSLTRLKHLEVGPFCSELEEFPGLTSIPQLYTSLEKLRLIGWDKLKFLPHRLRHFTALKELELWHFNGLEALPEWLGDLSSLQKLMTYKCSNLTHLPSIVAMRSLNLRYLCIIECPKLKKRCVKYWGPEWSKISRIQEVNIDRKNVRRKYKFLRGLRF